MQSPRAGRIAGAAAALVGVLVGLPSLAFPLGHDQGLYEYVGREWLVHGAIPYRDVLEQKTPGVFLVNGLAIALFGEHPWGVRVLELLAVIALGVLAAETQAKRPPGIHGVCVLAASVFYYGFFNFWDTAQCELWVALFVVAAVAAITRLPTRAATIASGLACGVALVFKPPALFLAIVCAGILRSRVRSRGALATFVGLALAPWAALLLYFAHAHALDALRDVLVGANGYYARHEPASKNPFEFVWRATTIVRLWGPLGFATALAWVVTWRRTRGPATAAWLALGALLAVWSQAKFYYYHWSLFVGPWAVAAARITSDLGEQPSRWPASAVAGGATIVLWLMTNSFEQAWFPGAKSATLTAFAHASRDERDAYFQIDGLGYSAHDDDHVAEWLDAHSSPDDCIAVRGFAPEIYALAHRRYGGRFFWTLFLTMPSRAYHRQEWLAADAAELARIRPRFVVTLSWDHSGGPSSAERFESSGYARRVEIGEFDVLERVTSSGPAARLSDAVPAVHRTP